MRMNIIVPAALLFTLAGSTFAQNGTAPDPRPTQSQGLSKVAAKTPVYDEAADAKQQIAAALAKAKKENRRVLIQWGGNWCPWCIRLHEVYRSDADIKKSLMYEYDQVFIDAGKPAGKNIELAMSYGADLQKHGFPFLTILDSDGKPVVNQETASLEAKGTNGESLGVKEGYNTAAVLKFLDDHKATYENATERLDHAIGEAKAKNKAVFLHFGAPWCIWCHRLEDWMARPEVNAVLSQYFIDCKIDEDRTLGGKDIEMKFTEGKKTGIPVFFFVGGSNKVLATSLSGGENIGFPTTAEDIKQFELMLKSATPNMKASDVKTLTESLKPQETDKH